MKLVIDLTSLYDHITGIERFATNLSLAMIHAHPEHSYHLLFKNEIHKDFRKTAEFANVRCSVLRCKNRVLFNQAVLPLKLCRIKADVFFFPAFCAPWLFFSPKIADTIHDLSDYESFEGKAPLKVLYSRLGIVHAKHCSRQIVTVSGFSKDRIIKLLGIREEKISVIPNGVSADFRFPGGEKELWEKEADTGLFEAAAGKYHLPQKYLLSVSTIEPRKNIRLLIRAFLRIQDEFPQLHLVLCGRAGWNLKEALGEDITGPQDDKAGTGRQRIHITGYVEDEDLPVIYRNAQWFVFPSRYEGFGIPPLEAMASGCPVISSDAASMPEVLGESAVYFRSDSEEELVQALRRSLMMPQKKRQERIRKGLERASEFTWDRSAEKLNKLFNEVFSL